MHVSDVHRFVIAEAEPTACDSIDQPERQCDENRRTDDDTHDGKDKDGADRRPEQREPEGPNLPAIVRLGPGAARVAPLDIVQDDRRDRWDAAQEAAQYGHAA